MLRVLYLVHDLSDPAVNRRVKMLQAGGADVTLAGFRRGKPVTSIEGLVPIELGVTRDGRFGQRLGAVVRAATAIGSALGAVGRPDVIVARNLEMLALARRAVSIFGGAVPVVYECLDIHRLLLRSDAVGVAMRGAERFFSRDVAMLVTSSPAFVEEHLSRVLDPGVPIELVENKVLELAGPAGAETPPAPRRAGPPWRIGWFGALRCRQSLELLSAFSRSMGGEVEVILRGRPAYGEFADFDGYVASEPYLSFLGPYRNPDDLPAIYGDVHFVWAIDFFEEGQNSKWLLPNRLYEGCRHGGVPIAMRGTETGKFLEARGCGLLLSEAATDALRAMLGSMDEVGYATLKQRVTSIDPATWIYGIDDCRVLVGKLRALAALRTDGAAIEAAA
ncbi:glycosyl transferase family 1 [Mesorhizobium sp. L-8-10]|uniref:glycosyltransferase n=1 Tax=Mesorhizobium sp. L-8-10 TaxID=2744523 RepID=UPI0019279623|nr:glycosyltransferase [Mesorhizobium sp. L-8-10]BCH31648.1 glycosyl transferase family 1 [Mesorhizobium sp. L-8-10]